LFKFFITTTRPEESAPKFKHLSSSAGIAEVSRTPLNSCFHKPISLREKISWKYEVEWILARERKTCIYMFWTDRISAEN